MSNPITMAAKLVLGAKQGPDEEFERSKLHKAARIFRMSEEEASRYANENFLDFQDQLITAYEEERQISL